MSRAAVAGLVVAALAGAGLFEWLVTGVSLPGVIPVFGLVGCAAYAMVGKVFGRLGLTRSDPEPPAGASARAGTAAAGVEPAAGRGDEGRA